MPKSYWQTVHCSFCDAQERVWCPDSYPEWLETLGWLDLVLGGKPFPICPRCSVKLHWVYEECGEELFSTPPPAREDPQKHESL